jgi:hypothetical protein
MKNEFKNWRGFVSETADKLLKKYQAEFTMSIVQSSEIDRTVIMDDMRRIPNVTTVTRGDEISSTERVFIAEYLVRFVIPRGSNPKSYYDDTLIPKLNEIKGLTVSRQHGYEEIDI